MDAKSALKIEEQAKLIEEYVGISADLLVVAEYITEPSHKKKLQAIAKLLEREIPELFYPTFGKTLTLYKLLQTGNFISDEQLAAKIGESPQTVRQRINALKRGGINIQENSTNSYKMTGRKPKGRSL